MQKEILVNAPCGQIRGKCEDGVCCFLGIPFGKAERFAYPQPAPKWDGILDALDYGDAPLQKLAFDPVDTNAADADFYIREVLKGVDVNYSEDCLNLNIWAPEDAKDAPVLVVIYGGGLVTGRTNELCYDGTALAKKGIITVFLSYRVNIFGFIALKALAERDGKSGNYGYYDQQLGIEWVRNNIAAFGGNRENMSLAGQSAGAASCEAQIKSPLNSGYFKQAFIQSSAGFTTGLKAKDNREAEYAKWQKIYDASGCSSLDEFIALPAKEIFRIFEENGGNKVPFCNILYDENFASEKKNQPCPTRIMIGVTSEDVMPLILHIFSGILARSQKKIKADTYRYYFKRQLPGDDRGAWHSSDLWYFYGALQKCWRPFETADWELSDRMITYAANFMKKGDPNGDGLPKWHSFSQDSKSYMFFDKKDSRMDCPGFFRLLKATIKAGNPT